MDTARAVEVVTNYCRTARLGPVQTEVLLLHLCEGMTAAQVRLQLKLKRVAEVRQLIESGLAKLVRLAGFREVLKSVVGPNQWQRFVDHGEDDLSVEEAMRGPRPAVAQTPQIGETWTELCRIPGTPKREGVIVQMAVTVPRWW